MNSRISRADGDIRLSTLDQPPGNFRRSPLAFSKCPFVSAANGAMYRTRTLRKSTQLGTETRDQVPPESLPDAEFAV